MAAGPPKRPISRPDRRGNIRYQTKTTVAIDIESETSEYKLNDYSRGGMSFICKKSLEPDTNLILNFNSDANEATASVSVNAIVVIGDIPWPNKQKQVGFRVNCRFVQKLEDESWGTFKYPLEDTSNW